MSHIDTLITTLAETLDMSHSTRYVPNKIADRSNPLFVRRAAALGVSYADIGKLIGCTPEAVRQCVKHVTYKDYPSV
jgi:hypothetical protein